MYILDRSLRCLEHWPTLLYSKGSMLFSLPVDQYLLGLLQWPVLIIQGCRCRSFPLDSTWERASIDLLFLFSSFSYSSISPSLPHLKRSKALTNVFMRDSEVHQAEMGKRSKKPQRLIYSVYCRSDKAVLYALLLGQKRMNIWCGHRLWKSIKALWFVSLLTQDIKLH